MTSRLTTEEDVGLHSPSEEVYPTLGGRGGPHGLSSFLLYAGDHFLSDDILELLLFGMDADTLPAYDIRVDASR